MAGASQFYKQALFRSLLHAREEAENTHIEHFIKYLGIGLKKPGEIEYLGLGGEDLIFIKLIDRVDTKRKRNDRGGKGAAGFIAELGNKL